MDDLRKHPLHIDVANLYDAVVRKMAFKGKEGEHKAALKRVCEVIEKSMESYHKASASGIKKS